MPDVRRVRSAPLRRRLPTYRLMQTIQTKRKPVPRAPIRPRHKTPRHRPPHRTPQPARPAEQAAARAAPQSRPGTKSCSATPASPSKPTPLPSLTPRSPSGAESAPRFTAHTSRILTPPPNVIPTTGTPWPGPPPQPHLSASPSRPRRPPQPPQPLARPQLAVDQNPSVSPAVAPVARTPCCRVWRSSILLADCRRPRIGCRRRFYWCRLARVLRR